MLNRPIPRSSKLGILGLIIIVVIGTIPLLMMCPRESNTQKQSRGYSEPNEPNTITIVPELRVGDYTLGMSKDEVLKRLGEPKLISWEGESYTLNNLPRSYVMHFSGISFEIADDSVNGINVNSPLYKFANGLGVGDSENKIKQAFGNNFHLKEVAGKAFLTYEDEGLHFEIHQKNRTVMEITVSQITNDHGDSDAPDSGKVIMLNEQPPGPIIFPKIDKHVIPEPWHRGTLNELPPSISEEFFQIDLRSYDLSSLDLRNALYELLHSEFDSSTVWPAPDKMPKGFDLNKIMKYGKNPGLNVKSLHNQGITGKNMGIAIIDQVLLTGHEEYRDRLRFYEEVHVFEHKTGADSHASGVASVAAGTSIGVAPEADLYFIGCYFWEWENHPIVLNFKYIAQAVRRIIAINRQLPNDRKIQAISISRGFDDTYKGYDEIVAACYEAKAEGLFVVCANIELLYNNFDFHALGRDPLGNPNDFNSYIPGNWWEQVFYNYPDSFFKNEVLLVPSGSRVKALDTANDHYKFSVGGGQSSVVPYVAGLYVLAKQVNSEITPEQFCSTALQTGRTIQLQHKEKTYSFGKIVDPVALINAIQSVSAYQDIQTHPQTHSETQTIVPGQRVGDYTLDMSKDEVLKKLGEPKVINYSGEHFRLNDLPTKYFIHFGDISFYIVDDSVNSIIVYSPLYKFANGLGVGDSEEKIKQAFGDDFRLRETLWKDILTYEDEGLTFEIRKKNRTVMEISVYRTTGDHGDSDAPDSGKVIMLSEQSPGPITFPKIDRKPKPNKLWEQREMKSLPKYNPDSTNPFQIDLRCRDLSKLDLSDSIDDLLYATFDDRTVWSASDKMPHNFTWQKFMELGENPGLGVRTLHKRGITGKGVGIAIIDQPLLTEHQEYADSLRLYEEIKVESYSKMHGAAVASIAVGKTVGVAPDADLYYIATWFCDYTKGDDAPLSFRYTAQSVRRLLEINRQLPADRKIRVLSISTGWHPPHDGYDEMTAACEEAKAAGIFVVSCSLEHVHGFKFQGLGRHPLANPDVFESYEPGLWWAKEFHDGVRWRDSDRLVVPMDSRTTASPTGSDEYVFYRQGGWSWAIPYIAGVYALAVQVDPAITPERFWALAVQTGRIIELNNNGETMPLGPIIDPVALISTLQNN